MLLSKQASELGVTSKSNYEVRLYIYIYMLMFAACLMPRGSKFNSSLERGEKVSALEW